MQDIACRADIAAVKRLVAARKVEKKK